MLPDLIEAPTTLDVQFEFSLPHDLFATLSFIVKSHWRDGFSEWVYEAAAALGPSGRAEVATLTPFLAEIVRGPDAPLAHLPAAHPAWHDLALFRSYLAEQPPAFFATLAARFMARVEAESLPAADTPDRDRRALEAHLINQQTRRGHHAVSFDPALAYDLVRDPAALAAHLDALLAGFGAEVYASALACDRRLIEQALRYHRRQHYRGHLDDIFPAVTGRVLPADWHRGHGAVHNVVFVPSPHIGPYFFIVTTGARLYVSFNARTVGTGQLANRAIPEVVHLFPPLKALADETRLHILAQLQTREHTQESLMAALGISQPTASRHLSLLERIGLLAVRRELGVKYYSVNRGAGRELISSLAHFLA